VIERDKDASVERHRRAEEAMSQVASAPKNDFTDRTKYDALMEVIRNRITTRAFDPNCVVPREHYDMILEAARHAPSGANAQPWHFIVVTDQNLKTRSWNISVKNRPSGPS